MITKCLYCGKIFEAQRATAKFDSGACKLKYNRMDNDTLIPIPDTLTTKDWHDTWGKCGGCDGTHCPEGFIPNWIRIGKKDLEALQKIVK
jgi:hypothetical protein